MYARTVRMELKPNSVAEFTQLLEKDVIPMLRKQNGFKDEIAFVPSDGKEAVAISFWAERENADTYNRATYPEVLKTLAKVVVGTPKIHTDEVTNSTFHKIAARAA
ncbi:MAG TPA: hypothetical protein VGQ67_04450 [Candidatus Polarisedimenticolia bacterium]|nr:hypothetical protein [Candidatus Polarisedimenticolia bacterium]